MFGNSKIKQDLQEIKNWVMALKRSVDELHCKMFQRSSPCQCKAPAYIKECGVLTEENEGENNRLENIESQLEEIKEKIEEAFPVQLQSQTIERFDDYMKNVEKLHSMINEFKGCVSMARASLMEKKEIEEMMAFVKKATIDAERHRKECVEHTNYALTLHNQHFKIEAMYKMLMDMRDPKPAKKSVRKKKDE